MPPGEGWVHCKFNVHAICLTSGQVLATVGLRLKKFAEKCSLRMSKNIMVDEFYCQPIKIT